MTLPIARQSTFPLKWNDLLTQMEGSACPAWKGLGLLMVGSFERHMEIQVTSALLG